MVVWNSHVAENYYQTFGRCSATCSFQTKVKFRIYTKRLFVFRAAALLYVDISTGVRHFLLFLPPYEKQKEPKIDCRYWECLG